MNPGTIFTHTDKAVATITFSHPKSNSFPAELLEKLTGTIERLGSDDLVRCLLLKSEGESSFCAGASFDELLLIRTAEDGKEFFSGFARLINAMRNCPKPIIVRVHGKAVGGGVGLIAAADYAFATEAADIRLSELSIGIGPFVIAPALERKMGLAAFSELALDAQSWKTAYWAQKNGLYQRVYEKTRDLDEWIDVFCGQLAQYNPQALTEMKRIFWQGTEHWESLLEERAALSGRLVLSDFTKEALKKFRE